MSKFRFRYIFISVAILPTIHQASKRLIPYVAASTDSEPSVAEEPVSANQDILLTDSCVKVNVTGDCIAFAFHWESRQSE